ncbi:MAG: glycosyltransferase family 4 protein [Thermodesulfobacteriota bacterium]
MPVNSSPPKKIRPGSGTAAPRVLVVSRCAWTLYNFRAGFMEALGNRGADVLCGGASGDGYEGLLAKAGFRFIPLPVHKRAVNPLADLHLLFALLRWYRETRPDAVCHFTIKPVIYGTVAAWLARVPRIVNVVTGLGYVFTESKITWLRRLVMLMYKASNSLADTVFFQNNDDLRFFVEHSLVRPSKARVLPGSGVDLDRFLPGPAPSGPPVALLVGRLLQNKGVYEFVEAARQVKRKMPEARFQLLGRRDERNPSVVPEAKLSEWIGEGVVEYLGEVADVRPVVRNASVVVLPSYREGIPRALLEAAAMGKPVVTTDAVGCRSAVDHEKTGLMVPVGDANALAAAMLRILSDPQLASAMGAEGRKKIEAEYDENFVVDEIVEALHVFDGPAGPHPE